MREFLSWKSLGWVLATIVVPAFISAYGPEIRRLLDAGRGKPRQWWLGRLKYNLNLLERLHNSSYELMLHFIWNLIWVFEFVFGYLLLFWIVKLFKPDLPFTIPTTIVSGICGRLLGLKSTVYALYDYEKATAKLKAAIDKIEKPAAHFPCAGSTGLEGS
ncbi:MAG: hypothetical protein WAQ52_12855 [Terriglobales bacterium]